MLKDIQFKKFSIESGLSQCIVTSLIQDTRGFIWLGTQSGLNRFDGEKFKVFKSDLNNKDSLQDNYVFAIHENSNGNLFLGSYNGVFMEYIYKSDAFIRIELPECDPKSYIPVILEDRLGNIWIGTSKSGLYKLDKNRNFLYQYKKDGSGESNSISNNNVSSLYFDDRRSRLYIGTISGGLNVFDLNASRISCLKSEGKDPISEKRNSITFIFRDSRSILWIGTHYGLYRMDEENDKLLPVSNEQLEKMDFSKKPVSGICEDLQGKLWLSTKDRGLFCFDCKDNSLVHFQFDRTVENGLICNSIKCILRDRTNVIWIGTKGEGLAKIDRQQNEFHHLINHNSNPNNREINVVRSIFKDSEANYWIGTFYDGLFKLEKNGEQEYKYIKLEETGKNKVTCIWEDSKKNVWITYQKYGICSYNLHEDKFNFRPLDFYGEENGTNITYTMCKDRNNPDAVWLGSARTGLSKFDIARRKLVDKHIILDELKRITIYSLYIDKDDVIWIGTSGNGLYKYETKLNRITNYLNDPDNEKSLSNNTVNCICENEKEQLWIGTQNGLNKMYKDDGTFERYSKWDGLNDNSILAIQTDAEENLWFSNYFGLSKFNEQRNTIRNYIDSDGLRCKEFNMGASYKSREGILYFGGTHGTVYFDPREIRENPFKPNIVFTDFKIFNESVLPSAEKSFLKENIVTAKEIILSYRESVFSFDFAALIYNNSEKNEYAYMMEGFDKDWVYCGTRRQATYTNLDPGEYIFRVKASNNDNIWNEEGKSIRIKITPPFWKTWWFKSFGAITMLSASSLTYKNRINKIQKEKQLHEEYSRKLLASQEEERKRIANELHDSIAHDILILKNNAEIAMSNTKEENTKFALSEISEQSTETLNDVRNISYNLHPHQIEALGLTKAIKSMIDKVSVSSKVNFVSDINNIDKIFTEGNELHVYRMIQEAISNIIKYSDASEAIIRIACNKEQVSILISDNGKGFDVDNVEKGSLGLSGISERVKMLRGNWSIESERGEGTLLKILIPIRE